MKNILIVVFASAIAISACAPVAAQKKVTTVVPAPPVASRSEASLMATSIHFDNGYRMYQRDHYRQASKAFERALVENPASYQAAYYLGMSHLKRTRYVDARRAFRLALELAPDCQTASKIHVGFAYSYEALRFTRKAHQHYHLACEVYRANQYAQLGAKRTEYVRRPVSVSK